MVVQEWSGITQKRTAPHDNGAAGVGSTTIESLTSGSPVHRKLSTAHLHRFFQEISANAPHAAMLGGSAEPSPLNRWVIIGLHARQSLIQKDAMLTLNGERMPATSEALWQALESVRASCQNWENAVIARPHRQACPCEGRGGTLPEDADKPEEPSSTAGLPMTGGLITAFGYDFARWCDPGWQPRHVSQCHSRESGNPFLVETHSASQDPDRSQWPELVAFEFEDWIIFDLTSDTPSPVILCESDERRTNYGAAWLTCIQGTMDSRFRGNDNLNHPDILSSYLKTFTPSLDQAAFEQAVERIQDDIRRGEIYQANLSLRLEKTLTLDPLALFETLCTRNPSPFSAYLHWPDSTGKRCAIVSNSPERLVSVDAGGKAQVRPIAGTRGRGQSAGEDAAIGDILRANPKERAEHMMLVDLARNDLGRVCAAGSVSVDELLVLERYSHVTHLVSNVRGDLSPDSTGFDLLRAVFPGGTITGCPKLRCMEILDAIEPVSRGFYTGSLGWMDVASPALDLNILIRSVFLREADTPSPASRQHIHANAANAAGLRYNAAVHVGAGIVYDAVPAHEYRECLRKATATLAALQELESHPHPSPPPSRERGTVTGNAYAYAESK